MAITNTLLSTNPVSKNPVIAVSLDIVDCNLVNYLYHSLALTQDRCFYFSISKQRVDMASDLACVAAGELLNVERVVLLQHVNGLRAPRQVAAEAEVCTLCIGHSGGSQEEGLNECWTPGKRCTETNEK